jgi:hypothetical protein
VLAEVTDDPGAVPAPARNTVSPESLEPQDASTDT